jgi:hypothetical protein
MESRLTRTKKHDKISINMKKSLFILFIAVFLGSCEGEFDDTIYTIKNDSSQIISFKFNDISENLDIGKSITYKINSEKGRFAPADITYSGHKRSIIYTMKNNGTEGIFYTFNDNKPFKLKIENKLSIPITITAGDFIDNDGQSIIKVIEKEIIDMTTLLIYTSTPNFSVTESDESERTLDPMEVGYIPYPYPYQIKFEWNLEEDTIKLTIK